MKTTIAQTDAPEPRAHAVREAARLLAQGEAVALPTETVYGLAADALRADAVLKIFEAKERPFFDPLIVHLPARDWLEHVAIPQSGIVEKLIETFWPGPLTLVLPRRASVPDVTASGLPTVAVRMSAHPVFQAVIGRFGGPLAAPSANRFGRISPTSAAHVFTELGERIPLIVDGGATAHGVESTIISASRKTITILRAGPVTPEELAPFGEVIFASAPGEKPDAPGQLASHYAPRTPLRIGQRADFAGAENGAHVGLLAWREASIDAGFAAVEVLSAAGDLREAAATLFSKMRALDDARLDLILAEPVPETGLGIAIMDRLRRAAARDA